MTAKELVFDIDARNRMLAGIDILARSVAVTLGPRGRNVLLEQASGAPRVTKDGASVAHAIALEDCFENMGAQMVKEAVSRTNEDAGDGTSTATVLARAMAREGLKAVAAGANPMDVKRGMDHACEVVAAQIRAGARPVSGTAEIAEIGAVSANGEADIGRQIAEAMARVGEDGVITVEQSEGLATETEVVRGMRFDRGWLSPHFVTDPEKMHADFEDVLVLVHENTLSTLQPLAPLLEQVMQSHKPLLIIAGDVEGEALATLALNKLRGGLNVVAVKAPGFGSARRAMLEDIAVLTGGRMICDDLGIRLENVEPWMLGRAARVTVTKDATTLVGGAGARPDIAARSDQIRRERDAATSEHDRETLRQRLAKLAGGVAVIRVGGLSEAEMHERCDRAEDALAATRAAVLEGIVVGGGVALLRSGEALQGLAGENDDQSRGIAIVRDVLEAPLCQIADNAGFDGTFVVGKIKAAHAPDYGFDAFQGEYGDLAARGIIDPAKVLRVAVQNACSVAGALITTQVAIAEREADAEPAADAA